MWFFFIEEGILDLGVNHRLSKDLFAITAP